METLVSPFVALVYFRDQFRKNEINLGINESTPFFSRLLSFLLGLSPWSWIFFRSRTVQALAKSSPPLALPGQCRGLEGLIESLSSNNLQWKVCRIICKVAVSDQSEDRKLIVCK